MIAGAPQVVNLFIKPVNNNDIDYELSNIVKALRFQLSFQDGAPSCNPEVFFPPINL